MKKDFNSAERIFCKFSFWICCEVKRGIGWETDKLPKKTGINFFFFIFHYRKKLSFWRLLSRKITHQGKQRIDTTNSNEGWKSRDLAHIFHWDYEKYFFLPLAVHIIFYFYIIGTATKFNWTEKKNNLFKKQKSPSHELAW